MVQRQGVPDRCAHDARQPVTHRGRHGADQCRGGFDRNGVAAVEEDFADRGIPPAGGGVAVAVVGALASGEAAPGAELGVLFVYDGGAADHYAALCRRFSEALRSVSQGNLLLEPLPRDWKGSPRPFPFRVRGPSPHRWHCRRASGTDPGAVRVRLRRWRDRNAVRVGAAGGSGPGRGAGTAYRLVGSGGRGPGRTRPAVH